MTARAAERGLTLIECLVALAILALVVTMSFTVLERHKKYLERMDARLLATRAAEYELETLLAEPTAALPTAAEMVPVPAPPPELQKLEGSRMSYAIAGTDLPALRRLRVEVRWKQDGGRGVIAEALLYGGARGRP